MKTIKFLALFAIIPLLNLPAQEAPSRDVLKDGSIAEQFDHVVKSSNRYRDGERQYRVIREDWMGKLQQNVEKAIEDLKAEQVSDASSIDALKTEVETLKAELKATQDDLAKVNAEKGNMNFLGTIPMKKAIYRTVMWGIVAILVALWIFFLLSFLRSNAVTRQTKAKLEKVRDEFDAFRKKSMEDDQKLRRQLQDELNKRL